MTYKEKLELAARDTADIVTAMKDQYIHNGLYTHIAADFASRSQTMIFCKLVENIHAENKA